MISWTCFEWDLESNEIPAPMVPPLVFRPVRRDEEQVVLKVLLTAFAMDTAWGDISSKVKDAMERFVKAAFRNQDPGCVVASHGSRVIGASLLSVEVDVPNNLLSGPMILHEYRNRGVGSGLLASSLHLLRERGLTRARGVTRTNSTVSKFVYSKFSSVQTPFNQDPTQL